MFIESGFELYIMKTLALALAGAAVLAPNEAEACSEGHCPHLEGWESLAPLNAAAIPSDGVLVLRCTSGLDRGVVLVAGGEGQPLDLAPANLALDVMFRAGRPLLGRGRAKSVTFNDEPLGEVRIQVIRGDRLLADGDEIDIG